MKLKNNFFKSLKFKTFLYFMLFSIVILAMIWIFEVIGLEFMYKKIKSDGIEKIGDNIVLSYGNDNFYTLIDDAVTKENVNVFMFTTYEVNQTVYLVPTYPLYNEGPGIIVRNEENLKSLYLMFKENPSTNKIMYQQNIAIEGGEYLVYGYLFDDGTYFYMGCQLAPIGTTLSTITIQLIIITITTLIIAFFISWFISIKFSKPIVDITDSAKELAKGNFDTDFNGEGYLEVEELSDTLNYASSELMKTEELRRTLISNVSHDLRTPLTLIKAYAEMIRDLSGDDKEKRNLHTQVIIDEADRLTSFVKDMLDLSKIQASISSEEFEIHSLSSIVESVVQKFNILFYTDNYRFETNIEPDLYANVNVMRIEQAIYNLIGNAVNYTGDDKKIIIKLISIGQIVRFEVTDTGKGIKKDEINHIWDRYYRSKESHSRSTAGSGIGLAIVKGVFEMHNAKYGIISEVDHGSTFYFELPIVKNPF